MIDIGESKITLSGTTYVLTEVKRIEDSGDKILFHGKSTIGTTKDIIYTRISGSATESELSDALSKGQIWKDSEDIRRIKVHTKENIYRLKW